MTTMQIPVRTFNDDEEYAKGPGIVEVELLSPDVPYDPDQPRAAPQDAVRVTMQTRPDQGFENAPNLWVEKSEHGWRVVIHQDEGDPVGCLDFHDGIWHVLDCRGDRIASLIET